MEEKKVTKISISTIFLFLAIVAIIVMGVFIYKLNNEKSLEVQKSTELQSQVNILNNTISDLQGKIDIISNTINNSSTKNVNEVSTENSNNSTPTSTTPSTEKNNVPDSTTQTTTTTSNQNSDNKENKSQNVIGKWNSYKAVNSSTSKETTNMSDIFGSSYIQFGSYLELKQDGSFLDAIQPVTEEGKSTTGSYTVKQNYYKNGDCYIFLNYSDGTKKTLQVVYYDDNIQSLVLDDLIGDYQISFKK